MSRHIAPAGGIAVGLALVVFAIVALVNERRVDPLTFLMVAIAYLCMSLTALIRGLDA